MLFVKYFNFFYLILIEFEKSLFLNSFLSSGYRPSMPTNRNRKNITVFFADVNIITVQCHPEKLIDI